MPQAVAAVASFFATAGAVTVGTTTLGAIATNVAVSMLVGFVASELQEQNAPSPEGDLINADTSASAPRRLVIGSRGNGGSNVDWHTTTTDNKTLYQVIYLGEGAQGNLTEIYALGRRVYNGSLAHGQSVQLTEFDSPDERARVYYFNGTQTTQPAILAEAGFASTGIGLGCAFVVMKYRWDPDTMPSPPEMFFVTEGLKLYDPRLDSTVPGSSGSHRIDDPTTWALSTNPAVVLYHYLRGYKYVQAEPNPTVGVGLASDDIDIDTFISMMNICDETVDSQKRYEMNGVLLSGTSHRINIENICKAMNARCSDSNGQLRLIDNESSTLVMTIDDTELPADLPETYTPKASIGALANEVRGKYVEPESNFQEQSYPPIRNAEWLSQDGGRRKIKTLDLNFETDDTRAQRLATLYAKRLRRQATISGSYPPKALELEEGDWFRRTGGRFGSITPGHYAHDTWFVEASQNTRVVPLESGADIYVNGVEVVSNASAYSRNVLPSPNYAGAKITSNKPIVVKAELGRMGAPESFSGTIIGNTSTRQPPAIAWVRSAHADANVKVFAADFLSGFDITLTPDYTFTIPAGGYFEFNQQTHLGSTNATQCIIFVSDVAISGTWSANNTADFQLLVPLTNTLTVGSSFSDSDGRPKIGFDNITEVTNGTAKLWYAPQGNKFMNSSTADGAGSDAEFAVPAHMLSDLYVWPELDLSNFRLVAREPCTVEVLAADGTLLYTKNMTAASDTSPIFVQEGNANGGTNIQTGNGPFRFVGTAPFYAVAQYAGDQREVVMLGALQSSVGSGKVFEVIGSPKLDPETMLVQVTGLEVDPSDSAWDANDFSSVTTPTPDNTPFNLLSTPTITSAATSTVSGGVTVPGISITQTDTDLTQIVLVEVLEDDPSDPGTPLTGTAVLTRQIGYEENRADIVNIPGDKTYLVRARTEYGARRSDWTSYQSVTVGSLQVGLDVTFDLPVVAGSAASSTVTTGTITPTVTGGVAPYSYTWSKVTGAVFSIASFNSSTGATSFTKSNVPADTTESATYKLSVTDSNSGSGDASIGVEVTNTTSSSGDVTPNAVNWGDIIGTGGSGENSNQTILGITQDITLELGGASGGGYMQYSLNNGSFVTYSGPFAVSNNTPVKFKAVRTSIGYVTTISVINISDGSTVLDTFSVQLSN